MLRPTPDRLRIAMVAACPLPASRGTPVRIHRMAAALASRGHQVHVVTYHLGEQAPAPEYQVHRIARVPSYRKMSPGPTLQKLLVVDPLLALRLRRLLREESFDLIHAHHFEGLLGALAARRDHRMPIVFDAHTLLESELPYYAPEMLRGPLRRIGRLLDRTLPALADHVIAVSEQIHGKLLANRACLPERISIVENGVTWAHFQRSRRAPPDPDGAVLLYTGNLASYQGIDFLLRALAQVSRVRPGVRLRIVTDSPFTPYESLARELGIRDRVELHQAEFAQIPDWLAGAHVALNPRVHCDGIPQKLMNYMAAGKAIVSFEGSARGLIDQHNALVVADGDVAAFAGAIERLLADPPLAARLGTNAGRFARSATWEAAVEKIEVVYRRVLQGTSR